MASSSTFCAYPFQHLNVMADGKVKLCYRGEIVGDLADQTFAEIWHGEKVREIRNAVLRGEWHSACQSCQDFEAQGVKSFRQQLSPLLEARFGPAVQADLKMLEWQPHTRCNQMCRMCNSRFSSRWESAVQTNTELKAFVSTEPDMVFRIKAPARDLRKSLEPAFARLEILELMGGELFIDPEHFEFLRRLAQINPALQLNYHTNGSGGELSGETIADLWRPFRRVRVFVSIDGFPDLNEYIRSGSDSARLIANLGRLKAQATNAEFLGIITVQALNLEYLPETIAFIRSLGLKPEFSLLQHPERLAAFVLPPERRERAQKKLEAYARIDRESATSLKESLAWMNSRPFSEALWRSFNQYMALLDRHHSRQNKPFDWFNTDSSASGFFVQTEATR